MFGLLALWSLFSKEEAINRLLSGKAIVSAFYAGERPYMKHCRLETSSLLERVPSLLFLLQGKVLGVRHGVCEIMS